MLKSAPRPAEVVILLNDAQPASLKRLVREFLPQREKYCLGVVSPGAFDAAVAYFSTHYPELLHCLELVRDGQPAKPGKVYLPPVGYQLRIEGGICHLIDPSPPVGNRAEALLTLEDALKLQHEQFDLVVQGSQDGIWDWFPQADLAFFSPRIRELLGYPDEPYIGGLTALQKVVHPDDLARTTAALQAHLVEHVPFSLEYRLLTVTGDYRWFLVKGQAKWNEQGEAVRMAGSLTDVTERKLAEEKYLLSATHLKAAQRLSRTGNWTCHLATGTVEWSDEVFRIFEVDPAAIQLDFNTYQSFIHPDDHSWVTREIESAFATGKSFRFQHRIITGNRQEKFLQCSGELVVDQQRQEVRALGAVQDITDLKHTELSLVKAYAEINTILESITDGFFITDRQFIITYWNHEAERVLQVKKEAVLGRNFWEAYPQAGKMRFYHHVPGAIERNEFVNFEEFYPPLKLWLDISIYPSPIGYAVYFRDITQRKAEEQQLRLLNSVITSTNDCILITAAEPIEGDGPRIIYVNDAFARQTGYAPEELIGQTPRLLQGPGTDRAELDRVGRHLEKWEPCEVELLNYRKDGTPFFVQMNILPVADDKGRFTHWISIQRDITAAKRAQRDQEVFFQASQALHHYENLDQGLSAVVALLADYIGCPYGEAWLNNLDRSRMIYRTNWESEPVAQTMRGPAARWEAEWGVGLVGRVWQEKALFIWDDLAQSELVRKEYAQAAGLTTAMGFPIIHQDDVVAILLFYGRKPFSSLAEHCRLLERIQLELGVSIQNHLINGELNRFFQLIPDLLCIAGLDGYFKKVNPSFSKLLGYTEADFMERPVLDFVHPLDIQKTIKELTILKNGYSTPHFQNRYLTKTGQVVWLEWDSVVVAQEKLIYAVAKDVTAKKTMDEERKALIKELTKNNAELKQFSYITSHNLRSPLTNMLAVFDLLDKQYIQHEETLMLLDILRNSTERLNETLNDLISILIVKENTNMPIQFCDFARTLQKVGASIEQMIKSSGAKITVDFARQAGVFFNPGYLESIFLNLLTNAIKYAKPHQQPVIKVSSRKKGAKIQLIFEDEGLGIDLARVGDRMFGLYQKFHEHEDSKGIGLYLVHAQVTALGGSIRVKSAVDVGTKFTISFKGEEPAHD